MGPTIKWITNKQWIKLLLLLLNFMNVAGRKHLGSDVCIGGDISLSCPPQQRIILTSSKIVQNALTCWKTTGPCFASNVKEIVWNFCSIQESCTLNNSQLIGDDSLWCGHKTVLEISFYCQHESKFIGLCSYDKSTPSPPEPSDLVYITVRKTLHSNTDAATETDFNHTLVECAVNLWHPIVTGFHVKIMDVDFPEGIGGKLCQESLFVGRTDELEAVQNYSHLFCDDVKTAVQARAGISSFQVLQLGHLDWQNHRGLLVEITGEQMEIEHRVIYSNQTKSEPVLSTPNPIIQLTTENIDLKLENILESYKKKQQNSETKKSNGLMLPMVLLVTVAMLVFVGILGIVLCCKRKSGSAKIREDDLSSSQRSAYVIGSMMDLRRYRLLVDGDFEDNFSPLTTTTVCSDEPSDVETFRHELDFLDEVHNVGSFQPVLEAISEENLEDLHEVMDMGHLELDGSTVALYGSPYQWKSKSRSLSPLTSCSYQEQRKSIGTVTIEMQEMSHDGHYLEKASTNEASLGNISSIEMVKNSFFNRLGLLAKHRTLSDISDTNYSPPGITDTGLSGTEFHEDIVGDRNRTESKQLQSENNRLDVSPETYSYASEIFETRVTDLNYKNRENETDSLIKAKSVQNTSSSVHDDAINEEISEAKGDMCSPNVNIVTDGQTDVIEETCVDSWGNFEMNDGNRSGSIQGKDEQSTTPRSEMNQKEKDSESMKSKLSDFDNIFQDTSNNSELSGTVDNRQYETVNQSNIRNCDEEGSLTEGNKPDVVENVNHQDDMNLITDCRTNCLSPKKCKDQSTSPTLSTSCAKEVSPSQTILSDVQSHSEEDDDDYNDVTQNSLNKSANTEGTHKSTEISCGAVAGGSNILIAKYSDETDYSSGELPEEESSSEITLDYCSKEPFAFDHISTVQKCHYNTCQEQSDESGSTNSCQLEVDDKYEKYDFSDEIELKIHNDIDLVEFSSVEVSTHCEDYLENVDLDYDSASNNSSFINISWSQTDNITRKKVEKDTCFTQ